MMNMGVKEVNQDAPDDFKRLLRAQLEHTRAMLDDYLKGQSGQMPHEWGSIDSVDYMMAALDLSSAFLHEGVLGDPVAFLTQLGSLEPDTFDGSPMRHYELNYACDGVAPAIVDHFPSTLDD